MRIGQQADGERFRARLGKIIARKLRFSIAHDSQRGDLDLVEAITRIEWARRQHRK